MAKKNIGNTPRFGIILGILGCFLLMACSKAVSEKEKQEGYSYWKDDLGREVKVRKGANRFLPFAPSVTEILSLVCDSTEMVGRTQNCNYPPQILQKPVVNNYPPDLEKILLLKPDLVITKDGMLSLEQAAAIEKMGIPVYFQRYPSISSIFSGIAELAKITGHEERGRALADSLLRVAKKDSVLAPSTGVKKVLMLISKDSYFCFGKNTYASDIIEHCGGINAVDSLFDNPYPILSAEYILKVDPDIILGGPEVGLEKDFFELHKELKRTKAYKTKQIFTIDEDYLSRPGPRVVEAMRVIRTLIHHDITTVKQ